MKAYAVPKICLTVMALVIFSTSAHTGAYKHEETHKKTIELKGEERLVVGNKRGDIVIVGEEGRTDIELIVTEYVRAECEDSAKKIAEEMTVKVKSKDGDLIIVAVFPDTDGDKKSIISVLLQRDPRSRMDIKILAPRHLALKLQASSGDIIATGIEKAVDVATASGDIELAEIGGDAEVGASSGDIVVKDLDGDLILDSASGDVFAENIAGTVVAKTASGDIELRNLSGDLNIITASGETVVKGVGSVEYKGSGGDAEFTSVRGCVDAASASGDLYFYLEPDGEHDYVLRTSSGQIDIRFMKQMPGGFVLKANTTNGDIDVSLPINISKVGRHLITGVVREGKNVVKLETVSGDITIVEDEE